MGGIRIRFSWKKSFDFIFGNASALCFITNERVLTK